MILPLDYIGIAIGVATIGILIWNEIRLRRKERKEPWK